MNSEINPEKAATGDAREIERFNALAATWWDSEGPMWPLHKLNRFRVAVIRQQLVNLGRIDPDQTQPLNGYHVLDIGCGGGILSESLARLGAQVTAVDLADQNIQIARQHGAQSGLDIEYLCGEVADLEGQFDLVFNMEVVEHVADLESFFRASSARVKPGGIMFLSTINRTIKSFLFAILGAEYILRLLPRGTHQWSKFVAPSTISELASHNGLDTVQIEGVSLNPFNHRYKLSRSTAVNYMMTLAKDSNA